MMHSNSQEAKEHADKLQNEIDDLHTKAQSSTGEEKQNFMNKIHELSAKKDEMLQEYESLKDKGSGFFGKLGM